MAEHAGGSSSARAPAGWYPDPVHKAVRRYWEGGSWTRWVSNGEIVLADRFKATPALLEPVSPPSSPEQPDPHPSGRPAEPSPSKRSWYPVLWLVVGGVLAVALGVLLVLTSPPAPIHDIPAQAGFGALSVLVGGVLLTSALIKGMEQLALRVRGTTRKAYRARTQDHAAL